MNGHTAKRLRRMAERATVGKLPLAYVQEHVGSGVRRPTPRYVHPHTTRGVYLALKREHRGGR